METRSLPNGLVHQAAACGDVERCNYCTHVTHPAHNYIAGAKSAAGAANAKRIRSIIVEIPTHYDAHNEGHVTLITFASKTKPMPSPESARSRDSTADTPLRSSRLTERSGAV